MEGMKKKRKDNKERISKKIRKEEQGITLVALVITIIIIIILATVTINMAFGDNGLITQAQKAKDMTANSIAAEQEGMNSVMSEYLNVMAEDSEIPVPNPPEEPYVDRVLPSAPELSDGMVPVKWNGSNWVRTTADDEEWYDYANKEWANIVLTPESGANAGKDATGTADLFNSDGILNEDSAYTMLVWIPRYAYQITTNYHTNAAEGGNINIVFIDTNNQNKEKTTTYSTSYPNATTGGGMDDYVVHPAFNYGGTQLPGFWVGKFETSNTNCTTDGTTGQASYTGNEVIQIKAGVTSWRNIQVSDIFTTCINMNNSGNPYGLNTSDTVVDPHMMKNSEWGAVAYLSRNTDYGKGSKVWINPNSNYITGQAGSSVSAIDTTSTDAYNKGNGPQASTTGNVTGVYDMSGGAYEYVAGYVNNSYADDYGSILVSANEKYKDVYNVGGSDSYSDNYAVSTPENGKYGDAVYETSSDAIASTSWYDNNSNFPQISAPFFFRGGNCNNTSHAGMFYFERGSGQRRRFPSSPSCTLIQHHSIL